MPKFIDVHERMPQKYGTYYVKVNGMKDVYRLDEFHKAKDRFDSFLWLDEEVYEEPVKPIHKSILSSLKDGSLKKDEVRKLRNFMGIKKANKIIEKIK